MVANVVPLDLDTGRRERANKGQEKKEENSKKINKEGKKKTGSVDCEQKDRGKRNKLRNSNYYD